MWFADTNANVLSSAAREPRSLFTWTLPTPVRASERSLELIIDTIPELACQSAPDGSAELFNHGPTEQKLTGE